ncbi:3'-5' exonuclease-like [Quercus robur]|uniref:3'-5' exonuclease-like n=1 Tax=Quercus robur TaxID=38942 RepID=UPI0021628E22|nr:3'-5' exonuclease-like [Quercus robur]
MVDSWLSDIYRIHRRRLHRLIVGLDVEWRPSFNHNIENPVATLQLCVGRRYLIFQLIYATHFPNSLIEFLSDEDFTFVRVGVESDVEKLLDDYDLKVGNVVDLCGLAVDWLGNRDLKNAGLNGLARAVLGLKVHKPRHVTLSSWRSTEVER